MTVAEFLAQVGRSKVISAEVLSKLVRAAPRESRSDAKALADWLVRGNHLTPFQAKQLLKGAAGGLVMGRYEILDVLGKGGMGVVYHAWDREATRDCALKILPPQKGLEERNVLRFQREMEISRHLKHPGVAEALDVGRWKSVHYLAMEYVPGPTLYRLVRAGGPIDGYWAITWIIQIAETLDYLHREGVIHRDLKPSNVIISDGARARLLDFGLARWTEDDHNEERVVGKNRMVGSFDYMAPEQAAHSASADARSDLYSLGCLLYFALVGFAPFHHVDSTRDKLEHHRDEHPEPLALMRPDLPTKLEDILNRLLAKNPDKRPQTAVEVIAALNPWPVKLAPTPPPEPAILQRLWNQPQSADVSSADIPNALAEDAAKPEAPEAPPADPAETPASGPQGTTGTPLFGRLGKLFGRRPNDGNS